MSADRPETVICHYDVQPGEEAAFAELLVKHWPVLHAAGLTTDAPARHFKAIQRPQSDGQGDAAQLFVEIFEWKSAGAAGVAHETPEVMAIWEPMGALCTQMRFPHFHAFDPSAGA
jgi:hypothetical protein